MIDLTTGISNISSARITFEQTVILPQNKSNFILKTFDCCPIFEPSKESLLCMKKNLNIFFCCAYCLFGIL